MQLPTPKNHREEMLILQLKNPREVKDEYELCLLLSAFFFDVGKSLSLHKFATDLRNFPITTAVIRAINEFEFAKDLERQIKLNNLTEKVKELLTSNLEDQK